MDNKSLFELAHLAGQTAAKNCNVVPMMVSQHVNPLDDNSAVTQRWLVADGVCGFAWVCLDGRSSFAKYLVKAGIARKSSIGGTQYRIHDYNQSMQLKEAYANAFAKVCNDHNVTAWADSRLD